ncbi:general transcription factor IIF subunit 2 isoform X2 [Patella vulgata]|uniref:general transcription factor IIF subunit 2 isoform X2 n=1 Tax=Patella vulgata TaxID=6465 RepID=UPI00217F9B0F|nr:general transcription factor IIF subunit 2 isoform X2 [Patella vulgata]
MNLEKAHDVREVDTAAAGRGVWLVKVPKYLSEIWRESTPNSDVGKLKITRSKLPGQKPEVIFTAKDTGNDIPKDHKFVLTGVGTQNLVVFSKTPIFGENSTTGTKELVSEKIAVDGKVIQRAECRPIADEKYKKLKRFHLEQGNKPKREIKQLDRIVQVYKPKDYVSSFEENRKKKSDSKRSRADKDKVMDMLFSAFEKHQYYNVQDLVRITNQPIPYVKEILKEICTYNMRAPHKNMWELKPEYRHYKQT